MKEDVGYIRAWTGNVVLLYIHIIQLGRYGRTNPKAISRSTDRLGRLKLQPVRKTMKSEVVDGKGTLDLRYLVSQVHAGKGKGRFPGSLSRCKSRVKRRGYASLPLFHPRFRSYLSSYSRLSGFEDWGMRERLTFSRCWLLARMIQNWLCGLGKRKRGNFRVRRNMSLASNNT